MAPRHKHGAAGTEAADERALRQADMSHLRLQDMTPDQRAELRRRYDAFVRHFGREGAVPQASQAAPKKSAPRKWTPGEKR